MKNIIVVVSVLLIKCLEATGDIPKEGGPGSPSSVRSRTVSASFHQKTKPICIAYDLSYYHTFIDCFRIRVASSKSTEENNLEEEFFSVLKSAYFSNTSFLDKIQKWVSVTRCDNLTRNKILGWLNIFKSEREQRLADYTSVIIDLLNGYVPENINESARSETESSFMNLLNLAEDNLDLRDIENTLREVFLLRKNRGGKEDTKEDEKADINELDDIDPTTNECFELLFTRLESYKFPTPSRSRAGSFL